MIWLFRLAALGGLSGLTFGSAWLYSAGQGAQGAAPAAKRVAQPAASVAPLPAASTSHVPAALVALAQADPLAVIRRGIEQCDRELRDYRCTFIKQERVQGKLRDEEQIDVRYRREPKSVFMVWERNADQAKRALYIDAAAFRDADGQPLAKVEPAGAIARLFVSEVLIPVRGERARATSRRTIDEFGFRETYAILERYNTLAQARGKLEFRFEGVSEIDSRPTLVFVRYLPYDGKSSEFPDAKMVMHIDQQWLVPTAIYSYADRAGTQLLGRYLFTNVQINPGLSDKDFQF